VLASALVWLVCGALTLLAGDAINQSQFEILWIAVLFTAWTIGFRAALLGSIVAMLAVDYFLLPPIGSIGPPSGPELVTLAIWIAVATVMSALAANLADQDEKLRIQQAITMAFSRALTRAEVGAEALDNAIPLLGAAAGALAVLTDDRKELVALRTTGFSPTQVATYTRYHVDDSTATGMVARTGVPLYLKDWASYRVQFPTPAWTVAAKLEAAAIVPLLLEGRTIGALALTFREVREFSPAERELFTAVGTQCALALERGRLYEEAELARAEAERANHAKSDFLAMMSHELRTPLNAIGGYLQLMQMELHGPLTPDQARALGRIEAAQQHLVRLISNVLNYAKVESGSLTYEVKPVLLADVLTEVNALTAPQFRERGVAASLSLTASDDTEATWVLADRDKLVQILTNLISNAAKFTPSGGSVSVMTTTLADQRNDVLIQVRDTGPGIPIDMLKSIFDPFVQVSTRSRPHPEGTGLGLAIARDLARAMEGDVTVESTIGAGSTFTVRLRRAEEPAVTRPEWPTLDSTGQHADPEPERSSA
jgi:signal transduction histidine kinase